MPTSVKGHHRQCRCDNFQFIYFFSEVKAQSQTMTGNRNHKRGKVIANIIKAIIFRTWTPLCEISESFSEYRLLFPRLQNRGRAIGSKNSPTLTFSQTTNFVIPYC